MILLKRHSHVIRLHNVPFLILTQIPKNPEPPLTYANQEWVSILKSTFIENIFIQWLIHNRRSEAAVSIQTFQKRFAAKKDFKQSRFDFPTETSSQSVEYRPKLKFSEVHIWCLGCLKNFIVQNLAKYQNFVKKWESPLEPKNHMYPFRLYCNSCKSTFWVVLVLSAN